MTRDHSAIGRAAQQAGDAFEGWLDGQHVRAGQLGILAHIEHNEAHSKIVNGQHIYTKPGVADYTGILEGGRYLAVEAKSTEKGRLLRNVVEPRQQEHLEVVTRAGGLALLLIEFRREPFFARYAVPWLEVPWTKLRTAESVAAEDIGIWIIKPDACYLQRFHPGGPKSSAGGGGARAKRRVYPTE